ncbi:pyruvate phosphate dikinase [Anopheles sinensis]|uniref:Pyruvate phosphate dikinase n=1 Tax=Anopheles sinensis TaxID=74873 RepID=A0A084VBI3_ANOSI|nr:pyruvate phosphate dikinase [Anopheles sinensis]
MKYLSALLIECQRVIPPAATCPAANTTPEGLISKERGRTGRLIRAGQGFGKRALIRALTRPPVSKRRNDLSHVEDLFGCRTGTITKPGSLKTEQQQRPSGPKLTGTIFLTPEIVRYDIEWHGISRENPTESSVPRFVRKNGDTSLPPHTNREKDLCYQRVRFTSGVRRQSKQEKFNKILIKGKQKLNKRNDRYVRDGFLRKA